ncbi:MAG: metallophosphoesterase [Oscillospiraceae bacterium]|jgi:predicted MPP superfamily phosphohydrolase|nr:metallophosphoesterase [Oscillospiraceae bacterium]
MKSNKKRLLGAMLALLTLLSCVSVLTLHSWADEAEALADEKANLRFKDGTFTIIQVADLQEAYITSSFTKDFLKAVAKEYKPNLFVLTGDNISDGAANWPLQSSSRNIVKSSIDSYMNVFDKLNVPTTMVFGNHDAESSGVSRFAQLQMYQTHKSFIGYEADQVAADAAHKTGNLDKKSATLGELWMGTHNLVIKGSNSDDIVFNLWLFDSGDYVRKADNPSDSWIADGENDGYNSVSAGQVNWFKTVNADLTARAGHAVPSFSFQHIIVPEVADYLTPAEEADADFSLTSYKLNAAGNAVEIDGTSKAPTAVTKYFSNVLPAGTVGVLHETPCPGKYNFGEYKALKDSGNVVAMFFGHDHVNTFELKKADAPDLVNSPTTGFGSYGDENRGVRIITIKESDPTNYTTEVVTYQDFYEAHGGALTKTLYSWRFDMFQGGGTAMSIFDWLFFKPLIWFLSLLGL